MKKNTENTTVNAYGAVYSDDSTEFTKALSAAKPGEISGRVNLTRKKAIRTAAGGAVRFAAMLLCIIVFLGAAGYVASYAIQYVEKEQQDDYFKKMGQGEIELLYLDTANKARAAAANAALGQTVETVDPTDIAIENNKEYNEYLETKRAQFLGVQRSYPEVWGWIDLPGLDIDYIIMQAKDNEKYLYHEYTGKYTRYGSIFADYRDSRKVLNNRNLVIYGHNMNTARKMFAPLLDLVTDEEKFRSQLVNIITPDGLYTYKLFSVYDTSASYNYIQTSFTSDEQFLEFCEACKKKSIYKNDVELTKDSKLITLSTCTVRTDGMRWAFHGVLVGVSQ